MINISNIALGMGTVSLSIKGHDYVKAHREFTDISRPLIFWNITYRCNLKCLHCYINAIQGLSRDELTTEEALRVIDDAHELGVPLLIISGGEPLIREDFEVLARRAHDHGIPISLSTNGTLISEKWSEKLGELGVRYVGISIDSPIPEVHDKIRGVVGAFDLALRGIKNVMKVGIPVGIRTTVTKLNIDHAHEVVELAHKIGVSRVAFYHLVPSGRGKSIMNLLPSGDQLLRFLMRLINIAAKYRDVEILTVDNPSDGVVAALLTSEDEGEFLQKLRLVARMGACSAGRKVMSIYPNGDVYPCQFFNDKPMGNVRRDRLTEIWLKPRMNTELVIRLRERRYGESSPCGRCPYLPYCGGCRVRAGAFNNDPWSMDPICTLDALRRLWRTGEVELKPWQVRIMREFEEAVLKG
ncbi:radical SAM/SPASM domain-containing protein [Vulcanisaeta thermophila]|uniref:radical SAM/SPASM domain-containing protein n=1 Tax=Vulcanisaeta thermophila TaxID=867917 RepID=UPI000852DBB8|nr:radical SAM protein [Vulcanisaeta thermophila]